MNIKVMLSQPAPPQAVVESMTNDNSVMVCLPAPPQAVVESMT